MVHITTMSRYYTYKVLDSHIFKNVEMLNIMLAYMWKETLVQCDTFSQGACTRQVLLFTIYSHACSHYTVP